MDAYLEQSVSGKRSAQGTALYGLCWTGCILLALAGVMFAANTLGNDPAALEIKWLNVLMTVLCLVPAAVLFRWKDHLRTEYDYILRGDALEISAILNARRRRRLAVIPMEKIIQCGFASGSHWEKAKRQPGIRICRWFIHGDANLAYLCYMEENIRRIALLELGDEMISSIRRSKRLPVGAWRNEEGKS